MNYGPNPLVAAAIEDSWKKDKPKRDYLALFFGTLAILVVLTPFLAMFEHFAGPPEEKWRFCLAARMELPADMCRAETKKRDAEILADRALERIFK